MNLKPSEDILEKERVKKAAYMRGYYYRTKEKWLERVKRYRQSKGGRESKRRWYQTEKGKEYERQRGRRRRAAGEDKKWRDSIRGRETRRAWFQSERGKERVKAYQQTDKGKAALIARANRRRARIYNTRATCDPRINQTYLRARELRKSGLDVVVDHIIPLARGGPHTFENLQIITRQENGCKREHLDYQVQQIFV